MFHPRTIIPLRDCGAALVIRSTTQPDAPGTRIDATGHPDPSRPTCVTSLEQLSLIGVQSRRTGPGRPIASRILAALDGAGVRVWLTTESTLGQTFSVVVPLADEERALQILQKALAPELLATISRSVRFFLPSRSSRSWPSPWAGSPTSPAACSTPSAASASRCARSRRAPPRAASPAWWMRTTPRSRSARSTPRSTSPTPSSACCCVGKGIVGGSLLRQLAAQETNLRSHYDVQVRLVGIAGSRGGFIAPHSIPPAEAAAQLEKHLAGKGDKASVKQLLPTLAQRPNPVLVDCTASPGMDELYMEAFAHGINVVSANKVPLALPIAKRDALLATARRHYRAYHYETTVGAALPVIETLKNLVRTGDRVIRIEGAFSGTLGYLCEQLVSGVPLAAAVRRAKELGYTEPHPRDDLSGLDVARKALILARELGLR
jgi:aspartokinase/homoserine dehydrogenase 1